MNLDLQTVISITGVLGFGGIIGSYITFKLNKGKELEFKLREEKQKRYKSILLFMDAYLKPENLTYLRRIHPALEAANDTKEWIIAEYHDMVLYASRDVVFSTRDFIIKPSIEAFDKTLLAMRRDLWIKRKNIKSEELKLDLE
jgi:hypothetical protein